MDIAKIRKKFKAPQEADGQDAAVSGSGEAGGISESLPLKGGGLGEGGQADHPVKGKDASEDQEKEADEIDSAIDLLTFNLAKEEYAFKISEIQEIIKPQRITKIPKSRPYLLGITSLRGKIIPVIDLKKMLSLEERAGEKGRKHKILILNGPKGPVGALIDRVIGVMRPPASSIVETPAHLPEAEMRFIEGVAIVDGRFISIVRIQEAVAL